MKPDTRALKKLKRKYSKNPDDRGVALVKRLLLSYSPGWFVVWVLRKYFVKTDYKAARESIKFFQLSNRSYGADKIHQAQRLLMIALRLLGARLPQSYVSLLRSALAGTLKDPTTRNSLSNSILSATKEVPVEIFDASNWYQLSRGLFSLGYFRAAWVARENSLDLSISESLASDASATTLQRGIEAHLERCNFYEADAAIRHSTSRISTDRISEFGEYLSMMQCSIQRTFQYSKTMNNEALRVFDNLVCGKTVAIVGLGLPTGEFGVEIDSADVVMRPKFVGTENLPDPKFHGTRCDVAQYNSISPIAIVSSESQTKKFLDFIKLIITTTESVISPPTIRDVPVLNPKFELPTYRSTAVSGMRLLRIAILGKPISLKIYGYDFYTKIEMYDENIMKFYQRDGWMLGDWFLVGQKDYMRKFWTVNQFSAHDPVSNFCFAQNLYKAGLFEIEPYGMSILELTPYQYVERLEERMGDW